jgi:hypothetical protein
LSENSPLDPTELPLNKNEATKANGSIDESPGTETVIMNAPLKIFEETKQAPLLFKCPEDE